MSSCATGVEHASVSPRRATISSTSPDLDVLYVGFVLGHGGDAFHMLDLAAGMTAIGKRVVVVVPESPTTLPLVERAGQLGVTLERTPLIRAGDRKTRQNFIDLMRFFAVRRRIVMHFHTGGIMLPRTVGIALWVLATKRAFVTIHSPHTDLRRGDRRAKRWAALVSNRFHAVVCPSDHGRRTQVELGVDARFVRQISNGIDIERFAGGDPNKARVELGLPATARLIVVTSRIDPQKRPLDALDAFARIAPELTDAHLVFVGSGVEEAAVADAARSRGLAERVHLVGYRDDVADWLAAASAWFLPTAYENLSLAVLEAMAAGCVIVTTRCDGNNELLADDVNALMVDVGDIDGQAAALRVALVDVDRGERLGEQARLSVARYGVDRMVEKYAECYVEATRTSQT